MNRKASAEDIHSLREILENLVRSSFDQEELMTELTDMKTTDPKYVTVMQDQKNLQDDLANDRRFIVCTKQKADADRNLCKPGNN